MTQAGVDTVVWLVALLLVQMNILVGARLTRAWRRRRAERIALEAPVVVDSLQDIINAAPDRVVVGEGPGSASSFDEWEDDAIEGLTRLMLERREQRDA